MFLLSGVYAGVIFALLMAPRTQHPSSKATRESHRRGVLGAHTSRFQGRLQGGLSAGCARLAEGTKKDCIVCV